MVLNIYSISTIIRKITKSRYNKKLYLDLIKNIFILSILKEINEETMYTRYSYDITLWTEKGDF